jgi:microcompartment protein CcmL/EutN
MEFSLGLVEVSSLGNAIMMLDEMTKAADVEFVACERKLGGRLVTIVVRGSVSSVTASVAAGVAAAERMNCLKASEVIARPHPEIFKFLHLDEEKEAVVNSESAATHTGSVGSEKEKPKKTTRKAQTEAAKAVTDKKTPAKRSRKKQS